MSARLIRLFREPPVVTESTHPSIPYLPSVYDVFNAIESDGRKKEGRTMVATAGIVAVVSQLFHANDQTSVWLTFAIVWITCALGAIASSSIVFRVAEVRNRIVSQQRTRRSRR